MMRYRWRYRLAGGTAVIGTVLATGLLGAAAPSMAATAATGPVSSTPDTQTPHLITKGTLAQVRQLVQCGSTMYAVGSFTQIQRDKTTYTRDNIISFSATSPFKVTSWAPAVNGVINSIAFSGTKCADAYIGGKFSSIGGTTVKNIAEISTSTGNVVTAFAHSASAVVETLISYQQHVIAGGYYTSINGSSADPYLTSLNKTTGKDDGFVHLGISGNYSFASSPPTVSNATRVFNQSLSHSGTLDLVMGDFTSAGGVGRQQIFMLNLATKKASVTGWTSPEFDGSDGNISQAGGYPYQCAYNEPYYVQAAAWSPDDSTIYLGDTGYHPWNMPTGATPRAGLCDAAAAFPSAQTSVLHEWVNYTGCDSFYAAAADASTAYFAGHERWSDNPNDCDSQGPGALPAPGLEGLVPSTGALMTNTGGTAGLYSRGRGLGADDMLVTSAGLWIGSDNDDGTQMCGGVEGLSGICFLPYSGQ